MGRSIRLAATVAMSVTAVAGAPIREASATGAASSFGHTPLEQRIAISIGPSRTTLWTSLSLDIPPSNLAIVVPAASGAALDWSSPAWMQALDDASAPRVFPPPGLDATCGENPELMPFHATVAVSMPPLAPLEVQVLQDAAEVAAWASSHRLMVSPDLQSALATLEPMRFVVARFAPGGGPAWTPTLRVVAPVPDPVLPFVLTEAGAEDLLVTTFVLGQGRGSLAGATEIAVDPVDVTFVAGSDESNYEMARLMALELAGDTAALVECASHAALAETLPIADGTASIDSVIQTYFEQTAVSGEGLPDALPCINAATQAMAAAEPVAPSCPRADLGIVDDAGVPCVEMVMAGEIDPDVLRCGPGADDLAVALSATAPSGAWLTRVATRIPAESFGMLEAVATGAGTIVDPVIAAGNLDETGCGEGGSGGAGGSSSGSNNGGPVKVPVYEWDASCACSGTYVVVAEIATTDDVDSYYRDDGGCGGDPETYAGDEYDEDGDCSGGGEPTESAERDDEDGGCGSDSSDTASDDDDDGSGASSSSGGTGNQGSGNQGSGNEGNEGSGNEGGGEDETSSDGDGCGSDTSSDDGCGCGDTSSTNDSCAVAQQERPRRTRPLGLSKLLFLTGVIAFVMRRWTREARRIAGA